MGNHNKLTEEAGNRLVKASIQTSHKMWPDIIPKYVDIEFHKHDVLDCQANFDAILILDHKGTQLPISTRVVHLHRDRVVFKNSSVRTHTGISRDTEFFKDLNNQLRAPFNLYITWEDNYIRGLNLQSFVLRRNYALALDYRRAINDGMEEKDYKDNSKYFWYCDELMKEFFPRLYARDARFWSDPKLIVKTGTKKLRPYIMIDKTELAPNKPSPNRALVFS